MHKFDRLDNKTSPNRHLPPRGSLAKPVRKAVLKPVVAAPLAELRREVFRRHLAAGGTNARLLGLALNEAEALAVQSPYPALVFPLLAEEKARSLARWARRQRELRPDSAEHLLCE